VAVADVWREVLGIDDISPDDNFYEIGGNSLYAIQIVGRLRELEPELPLSLVFTAPSVAELAAAIRSRRDIDLRDVDPAELAALLDEIEGLARPTEGGAV
jgi:acyl carrier protein